MNKKSYDDKAHSFGRLSLTLGFIGTLLFPLTLIFIFDVPVSIPHIIKGAGSILMLMLPVSLSEFLSIAPIIGTSAMYIMVLTGNFTNLKIPSSISAMESVGLDPSNYTEESDIVSTIAMATSTIVSEIIIVLGVLLMIPLSKPLANPVLQPAFSNIIPALFGALGVGMISKNPKLAIVPFTLGFVLLKFELIPSAIVMPILILFGVITSRIMYKQNWLKKDK
ncbi:hypothetical protein IMX26_16975 [Clostridium sp. 'deep sea']|uniref:hypothetical protein n=1 Tax=Clostridium sp. 'deep sea' TaxID=2779445 RepID=UPI001896922A|nr:hypothetical protein [Clostridium sp. 'deep sea']QOR35127.1 hypothetical protein IMX26_16975 [Clostridium sp. 'deep sea']